MEHPGVNEHMADDFNAAFASSARKVFTQEGVD